MRIVSTASVAIRMKYEKVERGGSDLPIQKRSIASDRVGQSRVLVALPSNITRPIREGEIMRLYHFLDYWAREQPDAEFAVQERQRLGSVASLSL